MTTRRQRNISLIRKAAAGCNESRDALIVDNGGIVNNAVDQVLGSYHRFAYYRDELLGAGFLRLVIAVDKILQRPDLFGNDDFNFAAYVHRAIEHAVIKSIKKECPSAFEERLPTSVPLTTDQMEKLYDHETEYRVLRHDNIDEAEVKAEFGLPLERCLDGANCNEVAREMNVSPTAVYTRRDKYRTFYQEEYLAELAT